MSDERDLDAFAERLDAAFAGTRPRPGYERELWARLQRRRWWDRVSLGQLAGVAAALVIVLGGGWLTLHSRPGAGGGASSASAPHPMLAPADRAAPAFGALPRPAVAATGPYSGGAESSRGPSALAPAANGAVLSLPARAPVLRYAEPAAADADGFASAHGAHPTTASPSARLYQADGFTLSVLPTNPAQGLLPSYVITPPGREPDGSGPDAAAAQAAAQRFLDLHQLTPPAPARVEATVASSLPTVVRWVTQVGGADVVTAAGTPAGLAVVVKADGSIFQASGPLPLHTDSADYPLAAFADLARAAGPGFDRAAFVYVLAFDGAHGYLEPAVLFTGAGRSAIVPAVAPSQLR